MAEPFSPADIIACLARHQVDYVLIGGLAGGFHGSPAMTNDADICPSRDHENLERLAAALREMDARIRAAGVEPFKFACDATFLALMDVALNLTTRWGDFDISYHPAGSPNGYADLIPHAVAYDIDGATVMVASLADIIRSKRQAGRPKDHLTLPILEALQDEIADRERRNPRDS